MKNIEVKIVTIKERVSLYEKLLVHTRYSLHQEIIPKEISYSERSRLTFHRKIKTFNSEEIIVGVLDGEDRYRNSWNLRRYISVPISYYLFVLIKEVGFVFTKEVPVSFYFKQSTGWVISNATLVERNNDWISFRLTVADMGKLGWEEEVVLRVLLKHEWTRIIKEAFASFMIQPNKRYYLSYEKNIFDENYRLMIVDESQGQQKVIYSITDTKDNVIELAQRIMNADCDAPRIKKTVVWSELNKSSTIFEDGLIANKPELIFIGEAKSQ